MRFFQFFGLVLGLMSLSGFPCTNYLISKGASTDGSTMITYAADSHVLYGELYHYPAAIHYPGTMVDVYEWDTGKFLGQIPQVSETYEVIGNMNEHQLVIGETTFGGRKELQDPKAIVDYGSLMYLALQRAKTAREAIRVMDELVQNYGYYSSGESFSIADPQEVWIMELIGKGPEEKGAVWIAKKIPEGFVSAHANQARIGTFDPKDKNVMFSPDVISFAKKMGYFQGEDRDFHFADTYAPLDFGALRFCEMRVYAFFNRVAPSLKLDIAYAKGNPDAPRLPLWIKPDRKLSPYDIMEAMRDHFQGTELDMTQDIGAGPYNLPYRWRPLTWKVDGVEYCHERAASTQQTGFSFVSQSRSWLPDPIGGVLWFGVDDTNSTVYIPMYCGIRETPLPFRVGNGNFDAFSWDSGFWLFNWVSNYTYLRYQDMILEVKKVQKRLEGHFLARQGAIDAAAQALHQQAPELARAYLTQYSADMSDMTMKEWKKLGESLVWKFLDGNVRDELKKVTHPGYPEEWYKKVIQATGEHFKVTPQPEEEGSH